MKYLVMIYCDDGLLDALPKGEFNSRMQGCFAEADTLRAQGQLLDSQQLVAPATARTVRVRAGHTRVIDGQFAQTRGYLGGYNLVQAADMEEAVHIASSFPWARTGAIEIRPVRDIKLVRQRVGA